MNPPPQSSIGVLYFGGSREWRHGMRAGDLEVQSSMFAHSLSGVNFQVHAHGLHESTRAFCVQISTFWPWSTLFFALVYVNL